MREAYRQHYKKEAVGKRCKRFTLAPTETVKNMASLLRWDSFETLRKSVIPAKAGIYRLCKRV